MGYGIYFVAFLDCNYRDNYKGYMPTISCNVIILYNLAFIR